MKCLTVWNPWAAAILLGGKTIENRPWKPPADVIGRRILIHAGKRYDAQARGDGAFGGLTIHRLDLSDQRGVILGSVKLERAMEAEDCQLPWCQGVPGHWAWEVVEPLVFLEPVPCPGQLGLFNVPEAKVQEALRSAMTPSRWLSRQQKLQMDRDLSKPGADPRLFA